jgi:hypothetical protein
LIIEQAVLTQLQATAALTALVSTRCYYVRAPQAVTAPYVILERQSGSREQTHDGPAHLAYAYIQIFSFASTYAVAKQIAGIIQGVFEGFSGNLGTAPYVSVGATTYEDEVDDLDPDTSLFYTAQTFKFTHNE